MNSLRSGGKAIQLLHFSRLMTSIRKPILSFDSSQYPERVTRVWPVITVIGKPPIQVKGLKKKHQNVVLSPFNTNIVQLPNYRFFNKIYEPRREKTNVLVSDLVRHKPGCTAREDS